MADTIRTRSAILTLLADNTTRAISPQDVRDAVVSMHGVYGGLYVQDGSTAQNANSTPAKMTGWAGNMSAAGTTPDHTDDSIEVGTDGVYLIWHHVSFNGSNNYLYQGHLRIDGVEQVEGWHVEPPESGYDSDGLHAGFVAIKSLSAGEKITVYIETEAIAGVNFTPIDAQLVCFRVA